MPSSTGAPVSPYNSCTAFAGPDTAAWNGFLPLVKLAWGRRLHQGVALTPAYTYTCLHLRGSRDRTRDVSVTPAYTYTCLHLRGGSDRSRGLALRLAYT